MRDGPRLAALSCNVVPYERRADSAATAQEWRHVALAIARKTGKKVGFDTATRMVVDASLSADCETGDPRRGAPASEPRAWEELRRLIER